MPSDRPTRDHTLMEVARTFAQRSTCSRLHVGAVFSKQGRILVTGYNGVPTGLPHCEHPCTCAELMKKTIIVHTSQQVHLAGCRSQEPCTAAEHAERNAVAFAARNGVALEGCEVHVTHMPCLPCAMSLVNVGVERVKYAQHYRILDGVRLLEQAGIQVIAYPGPGIAYPSQK